MSTLGSSSRAPQLLVAPDVTIPADAVIGANVVLHPGVVLGSGVTLEDGVILGKVPTMGTRSQGLSFEPGPTTIGDGAVIGSHTVVCTGAVLGVEAYVGDHSLVRPHARLGLGASVGHAGTIGAFTMVGDRVRMQGYCALASGVVVEDDCFLGPMVTMLSGTTMSMPAHRPAALGAAPRCPDRERSPDPHRRRRRRGGGRRCRRRRQSRRPGRCQGGRRTRPGAAVRVGLVRPIGWSQVR